MNNIAIVKKREGGSYDNSEFLFESVDLYGGDLVSRILELQKVDLESTPKKVKFRISGDVLGNTFPFVPERLEGANLISEQFPGLKFSLETPEGNKYIPDKNGVIALADTLENTMEIVLKLEAEKYSVSTFEKEVVLEDINIEIWSMK